MTTPEWNEKLYTRWLEGFRRQARSLGTARVLKNADEMIACEGPLGPEKAKALADFKNDPEIAEPVDAP